MAEEKSEISVDISSNIAKHNSNNNNSNSNTGTAVNGTNGVNVKKFKGVKVNCGDLRKYLYGIEIYRQASMLRKGREVHKIYVDVHKGVSFLDDRFTLTDFGKMVLENGSVRAGRARNVRQIVVARETLYCSGTGGCKRACGGYGSCVLGCDKIKVRGHKCSFRVKLTMRLGFVDHWFVEILGSHNCYIEDGGPASDVEKMLADYEAKSSDGEDSNLSNSQRASPLADASSMISVSQNGANFLPPTSSPPSHPSMLLAPAHCPLNVPLFAESYLMTVARNAAVAMTNGNGQGRGQSSPLSLSVKHERSPEMIVPEIMNGLLPPAVIPRFGALPSSSPPIGDNAHSPNTPPTDAMDLSTPRVKVEDEPKDFSKSSPMGGAASAAKYSSSSIHSNGHGIHTKYHFSGNQKRKSHIIDRGAGRDKNSIGRSDLLENIPEPSSVPPSVSPKSVFSSIPSLSTSPKITIPMNFSLPSSNQKYLKGNFRTLKPFQVPHVDTALFQDSPPQADEEEDIPDKIEKGGETEASNQEGEEGELDKDLINRVQQLEAHVTQLRNIVLKHDGTKTEGQGRRKQQREFDFTKYNTRHVALKIVYLGWDYHGYVVQEDTDKTIENALFDALLKTRLIEARETSSYHRCGRTDKGVSAFGQVISIDLRTNLLKGVGVKVREGGTAHTRQGDTSTEIRYVHILNKVLPPEMRVLAWAPVDTEFSARFSCKKRTYKYYFPKGNLNLQKMNEAAAKLIGDHDFRNLCKMDVGNGVINFMRKILRADIAVLHEVDNGYSMCELTIVGQAFLWHQIRCIVSVLFLVAQGKEEISIVDELLNVEKNPRKPQYTMASEVPLVLFDCDFGDNLEWIYEADWHEDNIRHLQQMWAQHTVKATMIKRMLDELDVAKVETESDIAPWNELSAPLLQQSEWLIPGNKPRVYKPLLKRQTCESLEERLEYYTKRRKVAGKDGSDEGSSEPS